MTLADLVGQQRLRAHRTSAREIADLFSVADLALRDAVVEGLSSDRRFGAAYDAVRSLATAALACRGYRPTGSSQHATVFEALPEVLGPEALELSQYFDTCRIKRNTSEYRRAHSVSDTEAEELLTKAHEFRAWVRAWISERYPELAPPATDDLGGEQ